MIQDQVFLSKDKQSNELNSSCEHMNKPQFKRQADRQETWAVPEKVVTDPSSLLASPLLQHQPPHPDRALNYRNPPPGLRFLPSSATSHPCMPGRPPMSHRSCDKLKGVQLVSVVQDPPTPPCCSVQLWSCNHKGAWWKCDFPASFHSEFRFINSFKLIITMSMLNCSWELTLWCKNLLEAQTQNLGNQFSKKYSIIVRKPNHNQNPQKTQGTQKARGLRKSYFLASSVGVNTTCAGLLFSESS